MLRESKKCCGPHTSFCGSQHRKTIAIYEYTP
jgi:hypothetical protein